jgi:hypothetical protein
VVSATPALQHSSTPALQHSSTPALQHTSTPALQHSSTPALQHSSTPALQHSSTPALQHTSTPAAPRFLSSYHPRMMNSLHTVERTFSNYLRLGNRGRDYNDDTYTHHNLSKKVFQRYGNSYILTLKKGRFIIGPHWPGVLFTIGVVAVGTWINLRLLHKRSDLSAWSIFLFKVFFATFFTLVNIFLLLTATTDPGILFENDCEENTALINTPHTSAHAPHSSAYTPHTSTHIPHSPHTPNTPHSYSRDSDDFCNICRVPTPPHLQIYHCPDCDYCIAHCDHHCPWMGQCVGRGNMRWFIIFNVCWVIYFSEFMYMAFSA